MERQGSFLVQLDACSSGRFYHLSPALTCERPRGAEASVARPYLLHLLGGTVMRDDRRALDIASIPRWGSTAAARRSQKRKE